MCRKRSFATDRCDRQTGSGCRPTGVASFRVATLSAPMRRGPLPRRSLSGAQPCRMRVTWRSRPLMTAAHTAGAVILSVPQIRDRTDSGRSSSRRAPPCATVRPYPAGSPARLRRSRRRPAASPTKAQVEVRRRRVLGVLAGLDAKHDPLHLRLVAGGAGREHGDAIAVQPERFIG